MWTPENRSLYNRDKLRYPSDLTDAEWRHIGPLIPAAKRGGGKRRVDMREVVNGVMYVTSPVLRVIALDAGTGREIWSYNPFPERPSYARLWAAIAIFAVMLLAAAWMIARMASRRSARPVTAPRLRRAHGTL